MKAELLGVFQGSIFGELINEDQGSDKLLIPCGWSKNLQYGAGWMWVWVLGNTANTHVFEFYKNGSTSFAATVTVPAGGGFASVAFTMPSGGLKGLTDYVAVDHNTGCGGGDGGSHDADCDTIWAGIYPTRAL